MRGIFFSLLVEILHFAYAAFRMTVMSFRVKPVGWRGIPNYYCRRFFDTLRLRMTCILVRDSSLRLRYVQNDKLVQTERGLTYALRDKIPMRAKSQKEKVCINISLVRKAVLSTEIVIENLLRCCKRTLFGIENHTFFFSQYPGNVRVLVEMGP